MGTYYRIPHDFFDEADEPIVGTQDMIIDYLQNELGEDESVVVEKISMDHEDFKDLEAKSFDDLIN